MASEPPQSGPRNRGRTLWKLGVRTAARGAWIGARRLLPGESDPTRTLEALGADWVDTLGELKGAAMKLGQFASQFRGAIPDAVIDRLEALQNQAEPLPFAEIAPLIESACGPIEQHFRHIEPTALAAASMGQVHRAQLQDGRAVVVKVRYPHVHASIDDDLRQLARMMKSARLVNIDAASLDASLKEISARLHEEADYRIERQNLADFQAATQVPGIQLPEAVDALCSETVLVLTELPAANLEFAAQATDEQRLAWSDTLMRWLLHQVLVSGLIHADPNPANFGFLPDGEIALYDFGCVKRLPAALIAQLRTGLVAGMESDWNGVHANLKALGALAPRAYDQPDRFQPLYADSHQAALAPLLADELYEFGQADIHDRLQKLTPRYLLHSRDFRSVPDLIFVGRTLSGFYWMLKRLDAPVPVRRRLQQALAREIVAPPEG